MGWKELIMVWLKKWLKKVTMIAAVLALAGCATFMDLVQGNFVTVTECKADAKKTIAEWQMTDAEKDVLLKNAYKVCDRIGE